MIDIRIHRMLLLAIPLGLWKAAELLLLGAWVSARTLGVTP